MKEELETSKLVRKQLYSTLKLRGKFGKFMSLYEPIEKVTVENDTYYNEVPSNLVIKDEFGEDYLVMNISLLSMTYKYKLSMARYMLKKLKLKKVSRPTLNSEYILSCYLNDLIWKNNKEFVNEDIKTQIEYGCRYGRLFAIIGVLVVFGLSVAFLPLHLSMVLFIFYVISFSLRTL